MKSTFICPFPVENITSGNSSIPVHLY